MYTNNYVMVNPQRHTYNMPIARVDQVFTDKTRMYAMFAWWAGHEVSNGSGLPYPIAQGDINNYRSSLTQILDLTHTFMPTLVSDVRLSFNRAWNVSPDGAAAAGLAPSSFTAKSLGLNMPAIPTTTLDLPPEINIYNCCTANIIGNTVSPSLYETYSLDPSVVWTHKSHTFHFGADFQLFHDVPTGIGQPNGEFTFESGLTQQNPYQGNDDGDAIAELLLGYPDGGGGQAGHIQDYESVYESYNYYAAYVQDDWKIRHNVTLNLGLRWETESSPRERNNRLSAGFCLTCTNPITSQINYAQFPNLPNPMLGGFQFASGSFSAYQNYIGTFEPKVGVSVAINPHLVMRGGYPSHLLVNLSGSSAQVEQAFHLKMQNYQHLTENRSFYAPDVDPTITDNVPMLAVEGLSTLNTPHSMLKHAAANTVRSDTTGSGSGGQFLGSDIRAAYAPGVALDGTGQTLGLIELGPYNMSDVQSYFSTINQTLKVPIYNVLLDVDGLCEGSPTTSGCDDGEEVADIEQAISMAPGLSALLVYEAYGSGSDALTAFTQAANDNIAKELSLSFGWGSTPTTEPGYEQVFLELAAQGVASGDAGANVGSVGYPGNSQYITAVGGTDLTTTGPGGPWQSEMGWIGSGGGWNTQAPIPSYQLPVINAANQGSTNYRNIPDVSAEANTDNYNCVNGGCGGGLGGTSLAAPRWAGFLALINQQANGNPVAFLNPTIYSIGQNSNYGAVFHDITTGDNYNSSPNMFSATTGYDLVTGWGTPNGQALIDALAPFSTTSPNFSLSAMPSAIQIAPGAEATAAVTVNALNGFSDVVNLLVNVIGAPAGVTISLSPATITGSGTAMLNVATTSALPGGNVLLVITGTSDGLQQNTYVALELPTFSLSTSPTTLYLNQSGKATSTVTVIAENGFDGKVTLSQPDNLPVGVAAHYEHSSTDAKPLILDASSTAVTVPARGLTITGSSGSTSQIAPQLVLAVSSALGAWGTGVPVNLSSAYNLVGIHSDGVSFNDNGMDGAGYAFSANLLTPARTLHGVRFFFGKPDVANEAYGAGQTIALPLGHYTSLQLLGTGIEGNQSGQSITIEYEDGSTATFNQSFSDWYTPSSNLGEAEAVAMAYRDTESGGKDSRQFNLYGYALVLDPHKVVKSLTLPANRNLILVAATLTPQALGTNVDLSTAFNATGIYTDGTTFPADGGIDSGGAAYSATTLNDATAATQVVVQGVSFSIAAANKPNVVYGTGEPSALPHGHYETLSILVLLCYKLDSTLKDFRHVSSGMVVACLHER